MTRDGRSDIALRLQAGLNGDADQGAATTLLIEAVHGVWLDKLAGWPEYTYPLGDARRPHALFIDWHQLREDLAADDRAWDTFNEWAKSSAGWRASDEEYESRLADMVPRRPWHGASSSELVILRISVELAQGGLLGDGFAKLDLGNRRAVRTAFDQLTHE